MSDALTLKFQQQALNDHRVGKLSRRSRRRWRGRKLSFVRLGDGQIRTHTAEELETYWRPRLEKIGQGISAELYKSMQRDGYTRRLLAA